jgi:predicted TIM-barrel fold metal-dependent hydrolase
LSEHQSRWSSAEALDEISTPIVDAHHHLGPRGRVTGDQSDFNANDVLPLHIAAMDRHGIAQACLIASYSSLADGTGTAQGANDVIAEIVKREPARFPIGVGTVDPGAGARGVEEIDRCIGELGLKAMSWHSRFQGVFIDAPVMRIYIRRCADLGVPIFLHVLAESNIEAIWRFANVARDIPDGRFVALDPFSSYDQSQWLTEVGGHLPNVWFETGCLFGAGQQIQRFVERHGASRVLFGSDYYAEHRSSFPGAMYDVLNTDWGVDEKAAILGGNLRELFGMNAVET